MINVHLLLDLLRLCDWPSDYTVVPYFGVLLLLLPVLYFMTHTELKSALILLLFVGLQTDQCKKCIETKNNTKMNFLGRTFQIFQLVVECFKLELVHSCAVVIYCTICR